MGAAQVEAFLTPLAVGRDVAASTQNQALAALLFLYREVLSVDLPWLDEFTRAKQSERVPVVLTREEVRKIAGGMDGLNLLIANFLYGAGLRLQEALRMRVKDLDFGFKQIVVRNGKGGNARFTGCRPRRSNRFRNSWNLREKLHDGDLGRVLMPFAQARNIRTPKPNGRGNMFSRQKV